MMNPFLVNKRMDLVDFGDCKLFMFQDDNLYDLCVSAERKGQSVDDYERTIARSGYPPSAVRPANAATVDGSRHCLSLVLAHLWAAGLEVTVLDIGAYIGDFSVKMANLARTFGAPGRVHAFDPTEAGALIPYNARLNGLERVIVHEPVAVGPRRGLALFTVRPGMSDAAFTAEKGSYRFRPGRVLRHLLTTRRRGAFLGRALKQLRPARTHQILAECVVLSDWVRERGLRGALFVKIDVEGLSAAVLADVLALPDIAWKVVVVEFNPLAYGSPDAAGAALGELARTHRVFDIWYSPTPARCDCLNGRDLTAFAREIADRRVYGYTDLLLVPDALPGAEALTRRLSGLARGPEDYDL